MSISASNWHYLFIKGIIKKYGTVTFLRQIFKNLQATQSGDNMIRALESGTAEACLLAFFMGFRSLASTLMEMRMCEHQAKRPSRGGSDRIDTVRGMSLTRCSLLCVMCRGDCHCTG